jgi:hypothetical protein
MEADVQFLMRVTVVLLLEQMDYMLDAQIVLGLVVLIMEEV